MSETVRSVRPVMSWLKSRETLIDFSEESQNEQSSSGQISSGFVFWHVLQPSAFDAIMPFRKSSCRKIVVFLSFRAFPHFQTSWIKFLLRVTWRQLKKFKFDAVSSSLSAVFLEDRSTLQICMYVHFWFDSRTWVYVTVGIHRYPWMSLRVHWAGYGSKWRQSNLEPLSRMPTGMVVAASTTSSLNAFSWTSAVCQVSSLTACTCEYIHCV